ncbi:hypothetical protein QZH41_008314, partial [Actinostola sp. cb2023]
HSCKNCGRIFCSSCTSQSAVIPHQGASKHKVCFKCFKLLTSHYSSPNIEQQSKENDLNKVAEPRILSYRSLPNQTVKNIPVVSHKTLDPDEHIRQRLQQLKEDPKDTTKVSDEDIGKRFEDLSGRKPISSQKTNINAIVPKKTEQEEISDLLNQVTDECRLDDAMNATSDSSKNDGESLEADGDAAKTEEVQALIMKTMEDCKNEQSTEKEIEERLAKLKGLDPSVYRNPVPQDIDSDDEEAYNRRYLQNVLGEAFLDDKMKAMGYDFPGKKEQPNKGQQHKSKGKSRDIVDACPKNKPGSIFSKDYEPESDDDELPWCCICNANAVLLCHGCDDDLYCKRCFRLVSPHA